MTLFCALCVQLSLSAIFVIQKGLLDEIRFSKFSLIVTPLVNKTHIKNYKLNYTDRVCFLWPEHLPLMQRKSQGHLN